MGRGADLRAVHLAQAQALAIWSLWKLDRLLSWCPETGVWNLSLSGNSCKWDAGCVLECSGGAGGVRGHAPPPAEPELPYWVAATLLGYMGLNED